VLGLYIDLYALFSPAKEKILIVKLTPISFI